MNSTLPRISIVTPTLNQGRFIEDCIISVISQNYPNLEYFILDGGSTDDTSYIVKKYQDRLIFISEKDNGQVDAINKGLSLCTGDIVAYLNSDDIYLPGSLHRIGEYFIQHPEVMAVTGKCKRINEYGREINKFITFYKNLWLLVIGYRSLLLQQYISQPSTFWRNELLTKVGYFNPDFHYAMDYDYWLRILQQTKIRYIDEYLAAFRIHSASITGQTSHKHLEEELRIAKQFAPKYIYSVHTMLNALSAWVFRVFYKRGSN